MILAPGIDFDAFLSPAECAEIVTFARASSAWSPATIYTQAGAASINAAVRRAEMLTEEALPAELAARWPEIKARAHRLGGDPSLSVGEIQLVRYSPGGSFVTHLDAIDAPSEWRKRSIVVYLNDDFAGGETTFSPLRVRVRPRAGYALRFPPYVAHAGETVERGEKFALVFWLGRDDR